LGERGRQNPQSPPLATRLLCNNFQINHKTLFIFSGGQEAKKYEFPHQALLGYQINKNLTSNEVKWLCGGSLISPDFVLTGMGMVKGSEIL